MFIKIHYIFLKNQDWEIFMLGQKFLDMSLKFSLPFHVFFIFQNTVYFTTEVSLPFSTETAPCFWGIILNQLNSLDNFFIFSSNILFH